MIPKDKREQEAAALLVVALIALALVLKYSKKFHVDDVERVC